MSQLEETIALLKGRRKGEMPPETAQFIMLYTRFLADGKPVSAQRLADAMGDPVEFITTAFSQMKQAGCEFNEQNELIGSALTLTPTPHKLVVDGVTLYAWCALDTLFLPAYIGKQAEITSTCPQTQSTISVTINPPEIVSFSPSEAVVSVMTAKGCSSGIEGSFCSQVHYFASRETAQEWIGSRPDFTILTLPEAYELAQKVYIEPVMKHV